MKMFIDTANVDHIREANDLGVICGVTTNPSLIAKEGRDFVEVVKEITTIVDGPISAEVISLEHEGMVAEARELVDQGVKELILVAQETTIYGKDIYGEKSLHVLLKELCKIDGIDWIRTHYYYTEAVTDDLIEVMATNDKICNYKLFNMNML